MLSWFPRLAALPSAWQWLVVGASQLLAVAILAFGIQAVWTRRTGRAEPSNGSGRESGDTRRHG